MAMMVIGANSRPLTSMALPVNPFTPITDATEELEQPDVLIEQIE